MSLHDKNVTPDHHTDLYLHGCITCISEQHPAHMGSLFHVCFHVISLYRNKLSLLHSIKFMDVNTQQNRFSKAAEQSILSAVC